MSDDASNGGGKQPAKKYKCQIRGCKVNSEALLMECAASGCSKLVHLLCFQGIVLKTRAKDINPLPPLPDGKAVCTKMCYNNCTKELDSVSSSRGRWDNDGKDGSDHTSMKILLDWWTTEGNYLRFRGKDNGGLTKQHMAKMLATKMQQQTTSNH